MHKEIKKGSKPDPESKLAPMSRISKGQGIGSSCSLTPTFIKVMICLCLASWMFARKKSCQGME